MNRILRLAAPLALAAAAACTDASGPLGPRTAPPAAPMAALRCTVRVDAGDMRCDTPTPGDGVLGDLIVGGQGTYVQIRSANSAYDSAAEVFSLDVTLQNLLGQPVGTEDGATASGIRIFFAAPPAVSAGLGSVEVANPDGTGIFTEVGQDYFLFPEILAPYERTAPRTWRWNVSRSVQAFSFVVYVAARVPNESGVLRWTRERGDLVSRDLFAVWGTGPQDIWAGGSSTMMYNNGTRWVVIPGNWDGGVMDIHGSATDDVWAVGGDVHHFDGRRWTEVPSINENWNSVWAGAPDNVYVTGHAFGNTVRWNGTAWETVFAPAYGRTFTGVWGAGEDDVFVAGGWWNRPTDRYEGWVWHFDGVDWDSTALPGTQLTGIWGSSAQDVYAIGSSGWIFHYDGAAWTRVAAGLTTYTLRHVWGSGPDDVWAAGGGYHLGGPEATVLHYDGASWTEVQTGGPATVAGGFSPNPDKVYLVGYRGMIHRRSGGAWAGETTGQHSLLSAVAAVSETEVITAQCGGLKRNDGPGQAWRTVYATTDCLEDVWVTPGGAEIFAVGRSAEWGHPHGSSVLIHWDGAEWTRTRVDGLQSLNGVWGLDAEHVYAVGEGDSLGRQVPRILRWDGSVWTEMPVGLEEGGQLYAVWGTSPHNLYFVGSTTLHWNGEWFTRFKIHEWGDGYRDVWGTGPNDVYVVGGRVAHWDGTSWSSFYPRNNYQAQGVWGSGPNDVYVVGGQTLHWNGSRWTDVNIETASTLHDITGVGPRHLWAVGEGGAVMRGRR